MTPSPVARDSHLGLHTHALYVLYVVKYIYLVSLALFIGAAVEPTNGPKKEITSFQTKPAKKAPPPTAADNTPPLRVAKEKASQPKLAQKMATSTPTLPALNAPTPRAVEPVADPSGVGRAQSSVSSRGSSANSSVHASEHGDALSRMSSAASSRKSSAARRNTAMSDDFGGGDFDAAAQFSVGRRGLMKSASRLNNGGVPDGNGEEEEQEDDFGDAFAVPNDGSDASVSKKKKKKRRKKKAPEKKKRSLRYVGACVLACQFFKSVLKTVRDPNWVDPSIARKKEQLARAALPTNPVEEEKEQHRLKQAAKRLSLMMLPTGQGDDTMQFKSKARKSRRALVR